MEEYKKKTGIWSEAKQFFNLQGPGGKGAAEMAVEAKEEEEQGYLNKMGSMLKKWTVSTPQQPVTINCSLTSLNIKWSTIMFDLLNIKTV